MQQARGDFTDHERVVVAARFIEFVLSSNSRTSSSSEASHYCHTRRSAT
jgi:hypothetical protein